MIIFKVGQVIKASEINANFDKSNIKTGTIIIFVQREAPTYWIKQSITNNAAIRIVTGSSGGEINGSIDFTSAFTSKSISVSVSGNTSNKATSGTVGSTTLTTGQMPRHNHTINVTTSDGGGDYLAKKIPSRIIC